MSHACVGQYLTCALCNEFSRCHCLHGAWLTVRSMRREAFSSFIVSSLFYGLLNLLNLSLCSDFALIIDVYQRVFGLRSVCFQGNSGNNCLLQLFL